MKKELFAVGVVALCVSAVPAYAATINYNMLATTQDSTVGGPNGIDNDAGQNLDALAIDATIEATTGGTVANAVIDADFTTGMIKFGAAASAAPQIIEPYERTGSATSTASWSVRETFTAFGSGFASFSLDVEGMLERNLTTTFGAITESSMSMMLILTPFYPDADKQTSQLSYDLRALDITELTVDETLAVGMNVADGQTFSMELKGEFYASGYSQRTERYTGNLDFLNTAYLGFTTTSGLSITAQNEGFLSQAVQPPMSAVPLPAGLPMLLAGLGGLAVLRRRS